MKDWDDAARAGENPRESADAKWHKANGSSAMPALTLAEWLSRDISEPDFLLGELFSTNSRALLVGPTGLGKTMFGLAVCFAIASGKGFLHWQARRSARVLYVDGEMGRRQMKRRLRTQPNVPVASRKASSSYRGKILRTCRR